MFVLQLSQYSLPVLSDNLCRYSHEEETYFGMASEIEWNSIDLANHDGGDQGVRSACGEGGSFEGSASDEKLFRSWLGSRLTKEG